MKVRRGVSRRPLLTAALLLGFLAGLHASPAQPAPPPTLEELLRALESNLQQYHSKVPSFFCDEHVESQVLPGTIDRDTVTDSVFRLKRALQPDGTSMLMESRDIKSIDGRSATGDVLSGPFVLQGAFSGGLAIVSLSQLACMHYTLRPIKPGHPDAPLIIQFSSVPSRQRTPACLLQEDGSGRVLIDPATFQITRTELTVTDHIIRPANQGPGGYAVPPVLGTWVISIDYAKILLGEQVFWMPAIISSNTSAISARGATVWSFKARYTNYHKLEVTSRIVPTE